MELPITKETYQSLAKILDPLLKEIVPDLVEKNKLTRDYINLVFSALIEFRGEKYLGKA